MPVFTFGAAVRSSRAVFYSHWRGRGSIKSEKIVTDFGSDGAIYEKMLEGQGPIWLGVVVLFLVFFS